MNRILQVSIDIAPTFLALAGAEVPASMQGVSFLPQVDDAEAQICDHVFAERNWQVEYGHERTLRHGKWSYYRNAAPELMHFGFVNAIFPNYSYASYVDLWERYQSGCEQKASVQFSMFLSILHAFSRFFGEPVLPVRRGSACLRP